MYTVDVTNNSPHPYRETLSWTLIAAGATETVSVADSDKLAANIAQWNSIMGYTAIEMDVTGGAASGEVGSIISVTGLTQAGGAQAIDVSEIKRSALQVALNFQGSPTTGVVAIKGMPRGTSEYVTIYDAYGTPLEVPMTEAASISIVNCDYISLQMTPGSFNGSTYSVAISGL